jgi:hypothetical protein
MLAKDLVCCQARQISVGVVSGAPYINQFAPNFWNQNNKAQVGGAIP